MHFTVKMTSKGRIVIPKQIRDQLNITPQHKLIVSLEKNAIVLKKIPTTEDMFMAFKPLKTPVTKKDMKESIRKAVREKYAKKFQEENTA